jgi:hypothetical protein
MIRRSVALTSLLLLGACLGGPDTSGLSACMRRPEPNTAKAKITPAEKPAPLSDAAAAEGEDAAAVIPASDVMVEDDPAAASTDVDDESPDASGERARPAAADKPRPAAARAPDRRDPPRQRAYARAQDYAAPEPDWREDARAERRAARRELRQERRAYGGERRAARRQAQQDAYDRHVSVAQQRSCLAASVDESSTAAEVRRARKRCRMAG